MGYRIFPLSEFIRTYPEEDIQKRLSLFRCSRDRDLEDFLHRLAIPYEKRELARVYLALDTESGSILVYFSLSMRCGIVPKDSRISRSMYKHLNVQSETDVAQMYLIGQLGRADGSEKGFGKQLMADAMGLIREANAIIGCPVVRIDCKPELMEYYTGYGFQSVRMNESGTLMMMVCLLRPQFPWEPEQLT